MFERPLRLKIVALLFLAGVIVSLDMYFNLVLETVAVSPPEMHPWLFLSMLTAFIAWLLILAGLWIGNKLAYVVALVFTAFSMLGYLFNFYTMSPLVKNFFIIVEFAIIILLLSLFNYYFRFR